MPHRRKVAPRPPPTWAPEPPYHSQPWAGWTTHSILELRHEGSELREALEEMREEISQRQTQDAARKQAQDQLWEPIKKYGKMGGVGLIYVIGTSLLTGKTPSITEFIEMMRKFMGAA